MPLLFLHSLIPLFLLFRLCLCQSRRGLSFDRCGVSLPCAGSRLCLDEFLRPCASSDPFCVCRPSTPLRLVPCVDSSLCPSGEECAQRDSELGAFCASSTSISLSPDLSAARPVSLPSARLLFDVCTATSTCAVGDCVGLRTRVACVSTDLECICDGRGIGCVVPSACAPGEVCAAVESGRSVCVGAQAEKRWAAITSVRAFRPTGRGWEPCTTDAQCRGTRTCRQVEGRDRCVNGKDCVCLQEEGCENSDECEIQEVCATNPIDGFAYCASRQAVNNLGWLVQTDSEDRCPVLISAALASTATARVLTGPVAQPAVVGGRPATPDLRAYVGVVRKNTGGFCNGVLVHPDWLLTVASCEVRAGDVVRFGVEEFVPASDLSEGRRVIKVHTHARFNRTIDPTRFDVALARLQPGNEGRVMRVSGVTVAGTPVRVVGYGSRGLLAFSTRFSPRAVDLRVVGTGECQRRYRNSQPFPPSIDAQRVLCAAVARENCAPW